MGTIGFTAGALFLGDEAAGFVIIVLACVCLGSGEALLYVRWAECFSVLGVEGAETLLPLCGLVPAFCMPAFHGSIFGHAFVALVLLLLSLGLLALVASPTDDSDCEYRQGLFRGGALGKILRIGAVIAATYGLIAYCDLLVGARSLDGEASLLATSVRAIAAASLFVVTVMFSVRVDFTALYRWVTPTLVVSALLFLFFPATAGSLAGSTGLYFADFGVMVMTFLYAAELSRKRVMRCSVAIAVFLGAANIGKLAGGGIFIQFASAAPTVPWIALLLGLFIIVVAALPSREAMRRLLDDPMPQVALMPRSEGGVAAVREGDIQGDAIAIACQEIALDCHLTPRELDVLALLARGRSQPYIRDVLVLSKNTVASYVKQVYAKVGVHSKQELIDLVQNWSV